MAADLPGKVIKQIRKAGLPTTGTHPFRPRMTTNRSGDPIIDRQAPGQGPKRGKKGYVDEQGRIWIKDPAHAGLPIHWDVQIDDGNDCIRIGQDGEEVKIP